MKISKKQKAVLKSYARGVLVPFLTFLASNELGLRIKQKFIIRYLLILVRH